MGEIWIVKYAPRKSSEIVGQDAAMRQLRDFIGGRSTRKAIILHGPYGCGKTAAAYTVADESGYEVVEMNASDFRSKARINEVVGNAMQQQSLFHKGKIILIDEIDGLSGTKDRGGVQAITALVKESTFPVVLVANNPFDSKFSSLRRLASLASFDPIDYNVIYGVLEKICKDEKIIFDEMLLKSLARRAGGDMRAAINDLQTVAGAGRKLDKEAMSVLSGRNQGESMPSALIKVFKTTDAAIALAAFNEVREDIDKQFLWIAENLPKEYSNPEDLAAAYDVLSRADVFKGRIRRQQHWRFLAYISQLLTAGVALSKKEKYKKPPNYTATSRLLEMYKAKMKYMRRKSIAEKLASHTHTSSRAALQHTLPYLQHVFRHDGDMASGIAQQLELDEEEIDWLE